MVTFCWLPPDSWRTSDAARVSIWSRLTAAFDASRLGSHRDRAPGPDAGDVRQGHVLAHGTLHEEGLGAVCRHVHEAGLDGVGRMPERDRHIVDKELAAVGAARAGEHIEQLILALAFEGGDTEDLAGPQVEGDVLESGTDPQLADAEPWFGDFGGGAGTHGLLARRRDTRALAEHQLDDPRLGALGDVHDTDRLAFAQDRRAIAHRRDLDEAV